MPDHWSFLSFSQNIPASDSDDEEETLSSSPTHMLSTQIFLTVHVPSLKKSDTVKLSPYCTVSEAVNIIISEFQIDIDKYQVLLFFLEHKTTALIWGQNQ